MWAFHLGQPVVSVHRHDSGGTVIDLEGNVVMLLIEHFLTTHSGGRRSRTVRIRNRGLPSLLARSIDMW
jgi:hypothetical protein